MHPFKLRQLVRLLRAGGVIAYPTEAVFGLGCDPRNEKAVRRLLFIKRRSAAKGLIMIAADFAQLEDFVVPLTPAERVQLDAGWPELVTWLLAARNEVPVWLRGRHDTLAVRITAHPLAANLCTAFGGPLVSTSANLAGRAPARNALAVRRQLGHWLDAVVPGSVGGAKRPSEIRDFRSGEVIRAG